MKKSNEIYASPEVVKIPGENLQMFCQSTIQEVGNERLDENYIEW